MSFQLQSTGLYNFYFWKLSGLQTHHTNTSALNNVIICKLIYMNNSLLTADCGNWCYLLQARLVTTAILLQVLGIGSIIIVFKRYFNLFSFPVSKTAQYPWSKRSYNKSTASHEECRPICAKFVDGKT